MFPNTPCPDCNDCPVSVTPLPLPDLSGICGSYDAACIVYTGPAIECLAITTGMSFLEILNIFNNAAPVCDCCVKIPQNCVVGAWSDWSDCEYFEDGLLLGTRQTRTRSVITPALNGGTACPALIEYQSCTIPDLCATFGTDSCSPYEDVVLLHVQPQILLNDKPVYEFDICGDSSLIYFIYWNNTQWVLEKDVMTGAVIGTLSNINYLPVSNIITAPWITDYKVVLLSTNLEPLCTAELLCWNIQIIQLGITYNYFVNVSPSYNNEGNFEYLFTILSENTDAYKYTVYTTANNEWEVNLQINNVSQGVIAQYNAALPVFSVPVTDEWIVVNSSDSVITSTSIGSCIQPPDVDCVWTCTDWSTCNIGCTQTRTCTITTPVSGNGTCTASPITQQSCCDPSCKQPLTPTVTIVGANVLVTFTAVSGAVGYTLTYTTDSISYNSLTSSLPSFSFPWTCGLTYSGWVVTNCATLNSAQTLFTITIPDCPDPLFCDGSPSAFISGNLNSPTQVLLKINSSAGDINGTKPFLSGLTPIVNNTQFMTNELSQDGIFLGGATGVNVYDGFGAYVSGGLFKLKCNPTSPLFFGEIDRTFVGAASGIGFQVNSGSPDIAIIHAIKYYPATNRIYVGGRFDKYKGVACSHNLVCINASTGAILPSTTFKLGVTGIDYSGAGTPCVLDIQIDESNITQPKLIIAGAFNRHVSNTNVSTPVHNIVRLNMDGSVDTSFTINATSFSLYQSQRDVSSGFLTTLSFVKTVYVDSLGDMYAGGSFYTYKGVPSYNIVKIKSDGTIASTIEFDSGTGFLTYAAGVGNNSGWLKPYLGRTIIYSPTTQYGISVEKIIPHINGILITGNFANYDNDGTNGYKANGLIKINTNGTRDTSFTIDNTTVLPLSVNTAIGRCGYDIKVLDDGKVLFGGYLTNYLGTTGGSKGYYVLNTNGTVNSSYTLSASSGAYLFIKTIASYFL